MSIIVTNSVSGTPAAVNNAGASGTLTFTNLNGGVNFSAGSKVVIYLGGKSFSVPTVISTPLLGGHACTNIITDSNGNIAQSMLYVDLAGSTTDSFSLLTDASGDEWESIAVIAWQLTGAALGGPSSSVSAPVPGGANPQNYPAITQTAGGIILVGGVTLFATGATPVWTGCTAGAGDMTTSLASPTLQIMGAHSVSAGSVSIANSTTGQGFSYGGIAAAFDVSASASPLRLTLVGVG